MENLNPSSSSSLFLDIEQKLTTFWGSKWNCFIGRETFIKGLVDSVLQLSSDPEKNIKTNFAIIKGEPGAGKSSVAAVLPRQFNAGPAQPEPKLICYAFSLSQPDINTLGDFVEYVCGCLQKNYGIGDKRDQDPVIRLKTCLREAAESPIAEETGRIYLLIDGLEEFPGYRELLKNLPRNRKIMYLLFAQPNVVQVDDRENFCTIDLPPLTVEEAKQILKNRLGDRRETAEIIASKLLAHAENLNPLILAEFAEELTQRPEITGDWWGEIRGLKSYFEKRADEFDETTRKLLGALAYAYEPLTHYTLTQFADVDGPVLRNSMNVACRFVVGYSGKYEYRHNAWKTYAKDFPRTGKDFALWIGKNALKEKADDSGYSLRYGVRHLIETAEPQWGKAAGLLSDFNYLMRRVKTKGWDALFEEYEEVAKNLAHSEPSFDDWRGFFREKGNMLLRGDKNWGAERILYQLAWEDGEDSAVSAAADKYTEEGKVTWERLLATRPKHKKRQHCLSIPHVEGAIELQGHRILSWQQNDPLRISDVTTGRPLLEFGADSGFVLGAMELKSGKVLFWTDAQVLNVWDVASKKRISEFKVQEEDKIRHAIKLQDSRILLQGRNTLWTFDEGMDKGLKRLAQVEGGIHAVTELKDGRLLVCPADSAPGIMSIDTGSWRAKFEQDWEETDNEDPSEEDGAVELKDGTILSWSEKGPHVWAPTKGNPAVWERIDWFEERGEVEMLPLEDGRLLSWSGDELDIRKSIDDEDGLTLVGHTDNINGAIKLKDGRRILSWSDDHTLRIWDSSSGKCLEMYRHGCVVKGAFELRDERIVSRGVDETLRIWDFVNSEKRLEIEKHAPKLISELDWNFANLKAMKAKVDDEVNLKLALSAKLESGQPLAGIEEYRIALDGAIELSNDRILSREKYALQLWEASTGKRLISLNGHEDMVHGALQLDNNRILSWSSDKTLRIWDVEAGVCQMVLTGNSSIYDAFVVNEGKVLANCAKEGFWLWDINTRKCVAEFKGQHAKRLKDGRILLWGYYVINLLDRFGEKLCAALYSTDSLTTVSAVLPESERLLDFMAFPGSATPLVADEKLEFPLSFERNEESIKISFVPATSTGRIYGQ